MVQLAKFLRSWFGLQALILTAALAYSLFRIGRALGEGGLYELTRPGLEFLFCGMLAGAAVTGTAWWKLRCGETSGRAWGLAASLLNLPLFGLGTALGVGGLFAFWKRDIVEKLVAQTTAERSGLHSKVPGDGTNPWFEVASVVGQVLFFMTGDAFWRHWATSAGLPTPPRFSWAALYELALITSILFHEGGHVLAGWLAQMKLRQFVVGPFEWAVRSGKWKFKFNFVGLFGRGVAGMVPIHLRHLASRSIFMTLGGPIGSLVVGSLATLLTVSARHRPWEFAWEYLSIVATIAMGQFLVNLLPIMPESNYSDGAQIYQLASRGPWGDVHMAFAMVGSTLVTTQRPRDYDIAVLERAAAFLTNGHKALLLRMYCCFYYLDSGRQAEAVEALRAAESIHAEVADTLGAGQHAEFVFVNALYKRDRGRARMWWDQMQAKGDVQFRTDYWKALTALLWIEGRPKEAREAWQKGNAAARALPRTGAYDFDRWCFEELRRALDSNQPPDSAPDANLYGLDSAVRGGAERLNTLRFTLPI